jgi:hypothetical protein
MITSKPANGEWPGLVFFTLSPVSCLLDSDWTVWGNRFSFLFITMSSSRGCGNCGKLGGILPSFPSAVGTVENMQFVFHGSSCAAVSIAYGREKHFLQGSVKKLGPHSTSTEFFATAEWYGLRG